MRAWNVSESLDNAQRYLEYAIENMREYTHLNPNDVRASELKMKLIEDQERLERLIHDRPDEKG